VRSDDRKRLFEIVEVLQALARLEFTTQARIGESGDVFDAVAAGVNMLGEELASFQQEVDERAAALARANAEMARRTLHDSLTGIANRVLFLDRIEHALARTSRTHPSVAVLFIDLDEFKLINDGFGHHTGDQVLKAIARRLAGVIRPGDTVARLGGDEFGILLEDVDETAAMQNVDRIINAIRQPILIDDKEFSVTSCVGIAFPDAAHPTADDVLRAADTAMYGAKRAGGARFSVYEPEMHRAVLLGLELRGDLEAAVNRGEISLVYQPIVELRTERVTGVEALARWPHPTRGLVLPSDFIPIAERSGLIVPLGRSVLNAACRQLRDWRATLGSQAPDYVAVNLSARQFRDHGLAADIREALQAANLEPERLMLEATESIAVDDSALTTLVELKATGVQLAIDDFGTGYSSLSSLARLPFDIVKLDRSFISGQAGTSHTLVSLVVRLAEELERDVVAEGVETAEQASFLRSIGCRLAQGFFFAAPMDAEQLSRRLVDWPLAHDVAAVEPARPDRHARRRCRPGFARGRG